MRPSRSSRLTAGLVAGLVSTATTAPPLYDRTSGSAPRSASLSAIADRPGIELPLERPVLVDLELLRGNPALIALPIPDG